MKSSCCYLVACAPALCLARLEASMGQELHTHKSAWEGTLALLELLSPKAETSSSAVALLLEVLCFFVAFAVIRELFKTRKGQSSKANQKGKKMSHAPSVPSSSAAWRRASRKGPMSSQDVQSWAAKVFAEEPAVFVDEFVGHLAARRNTSEDRDLVNLLLDVPAKAGRPDIVRAFATALHAKAAAEVDPVELHVALVGASAASARVEEVERLLAKESSAGEDQSVGPRSLAIAARGYLKCGKLHEAIAKLNAMCRAGHEVPPGAVVELARAASRYGADFMEVLSSLHEQLELPAEVVSVMLEHCARHDDLKTAGCIQAFAQRRSLHLSQEAYEWLLKLHSKADSTAGNEVLARMLADGFVPCEGLCRCIIARCAETKNVALAEALVTVLRSRNEMTLATFKTLMKVYAYASLFDKACDLYTEVVAAGMKPDSVMLGSLMKFSVKAGRPALTQEVFEQVDTGCESCLQNYMWLIRAAGQQGDVERAVRTFRKLQQGQPKLVDAIAFNITIDACASNRDMPQARSLFMEMQQAQCCNIVTYNTMMKGYVAAEDLQSARGIFRDLEAAGITPDSATFSCFLGGAVREGDFTGMWAVVDDMDRRRIPFDSYVVSIMMQAVRKVHTSRDADRLLAILDRPDVRVVDHEVIFNTALDACIYRRDRRRLAHLFEAYHSSSCKVRPTARTFGLLIKASIILKRTSRCWAFWNDMVDNQGLLPTDVTLGCMIDALVEAEQVEEALALFQKWQGQIKCDTIVYSTLIKGFASLGDAGRAMALYQDMKLDGVQMNSIAYTALINAHTRCGMMTKAEALLDDMQKEGCEPNTITYSSLVKGHCVQGDLEAALGLFHKMIDVGLEADSVVFNTLIDGCVQNSNWALADELLAEMRRSQVQQTKFTLSVLVKMWSKRRELDKAFECVYEALRSPASHKLVDAQVGACIVGACIHNRNPERALAVFEDMKQWKHFDGPDANTYSALISGLPRHGLVRRAAQLADEACDVLANTAYGQDRRPLAPNALQQLFRSLQQEDLMQELGYSLEVKLRKAGMKLSWSMTRSG